MSSYRGLLTKIIPTGAMASTNTITSQPFNISSLEGAAFQPTWTGTPIGTFSVLVSLDYVPSPTPGAAPLNAGTWTNLNYPISGNPSGSVGNTFIPAYASCAAWIMLSYTNASGSGVLGGMFSGKTRG